MFLKLMKMLLLLIIVLQASTVFAGWEDLFNGKNLDNWRVLNGTAKYKIEDGVIIGTSEVNTPNTFLATKNTYGDFILEYEVKMDNGLNSGVQIRSLSLPNYKDGRVHGYQVEIDASKRAWSGGIYDEARRGWLYHLEHNTNAKSAYKHEQWNKFRVEAIGNQIQVWLNGIQTVDLIDDLTAEGLIALQVHSINDEKMAGKQVRFRNIRIMTENIDSELAKNQDEITQVSYLKNQLSEREKRDGWQLLWDGKTTNGWRGAKLDKFPEGGWKIKNGTIIVEENDGAESANGGDIVTIKKYKNFTLELDFKYTQGSNSGIKYFVDTELNKGKGSSIGCEFQILDDEKHADSNMGTAGNRTMASLYDLIPANAHFYVPNESTSKRLNKYSWNRARIVVDGRHVAHYLNGIKVLEYERSTQMWRALVARSKYHVWPNFGEAEEGNILLQEHGDEVHFKNVKIKIGE